MKRTLFLALLLASVLPSFGSTTWFIRHDGGTNLQCTGKTNAAYTGGTSVQWIAQHAYAVNDQFSDSNNHLEKVVVAGTSSTRFPPTWSTSGGTVTDNTAQMQDQGAMLSNQACAYNHPMQMVAFLGTWTALAAGDTIQFGDAPTNTVPYFIGENNGGVGQDWGSIINNCPQPNQGGGAGATCRLPVIPSNVSIIGQNAGSCHDSVHTHLVTPTILSGLNNISTVLDVSASTGVSVSCIEVTQPDTCTFAFGTSNTCASTANFVGGSGGAGITLQHGTANGPTALTLTDVAVVGVASNGILGSKMNVANSSAAVSFTDVYVIGNGQSGINGDSGACDGAAGSAAANGCESVGTFNLSHVIVDWNGCMAVKPYDMTKPDTQNAFTACATQNNGGYGDGFVQIAAGNVTLNIDHSFFRWNSQDGVDALHLSDDITTSPTINIDTSWSEGNMGQTFKLGAGNKATATNNVSISNCRLLDTPSAFPLNPTGWTSGINVADVCRAQGDQWAFQVGPHTS